MTDAIRGPAITEVSLESLVFPKYLSGYPELKPAISDREAWELHWKTMVSLLIPGNLIVVTGHVGYGKSHTVVNIMQFATDIPQYEGITMPDGSPHPGYVVVTNMLFKQRMPDGDGVYNSENGTWWLNGLDVFTKGDGVVAQQARRLNENLQHGQNTGGYPPYIWFASTFYDMIKLVCKVKNHTDPDIRNRKILMVLDEFNQFISKGQYTQFLRDFLKFRNMIRKFDISIIISLPDYEQLPIDWREDYDNANVSYKIHVDNRMQALYNNEMGLSYSVKQLKFIETPDTVPEAMVVDVMDYTVPEEMVPVDGFSYDHKVSGHLGRGGIGDYEDDSGNILVDNVKAGTAYAFSFSHLNKRFRNAIHELWWKILADFIEEMESLVDVPELDDSETEIMPIIHSRMGKKDFLKAMDYVARLNAEMGLGIEAWKMRQDEWGGITYGNTMEYTKRKMSEWFPKSKERKEK